MLHGLRQRGCGALLSDDAELTDSICYDIYRALRESDASESEQLGYLLYNYFECNGKRNDIVRQFMEQNGIDKKEFSTLFIECIDFWCQDIYFVTLIVF